MTGQELKSLRKELGLSQMNLAARLGCSVSTIQKLELGKTKKASQLLAEKIINLWKEKELLGKK